MKDLLDKIEARHQPVRATAAQLREQVGLLTEQLAVAERTLDITCETMLELADEDGTSHRSRCCRASEPLPKQGHTDGAGLPRFVTPRYSGRTGLCYCGANMACRADHARALWVRWDRPSRFQWKMTWRARTWRRPRSSRPAWAAAPSAAPV